MLFKDLYSVCSNLKNRDDRGSYERNFCREVNSESMFRKICYERSCMFRYVWR